MNDNDPFASGNDSVETPAAAQPAETAEPSDPIDTLVDDARRALRAVVIGLIALPLGFALQQAFGRSDQVGLSILIFLVLGLVGEIYGTSLLVRVYPSRKSLPKKSRRRVRIAAVLNVCFYLTLLAMFVTLLLPPRQRDDDLRRFEHPPGLVGTWEFKSPDGKVHVELILKANGDARYRQISESKWDFRGSWCLQDWYFYVRMERLLGGDWPHGEQIARFDFDGFTKNTLILRDSAGSAPFRFLRKHE